MSETERRRARKFSSCLALPFLVGAQGKQRDAGLVSGTLEEMRSVFQVCSFPGTPPPPLSTGKGDTAPACGARESGVRQGRRPGA